MSCPAPGFLKVSTVCCSSCSFSPSYGPWKQWTEVLFLIKLNSIHSLVAVMKWLASIGGKVSVWWALTLCMIKDTGKWSPHSLIPWKLSSISKIKAARGREGICFHHPQVEHILPAPGIQHTPINTAKCRDEAHRSSMLTVLTSPAVIQKKRAAELPSSAEGEFCAVQLHQWESCSFKKE